MSKSRGFKFDDPTPSPQSLNNNNTNKNDNVQLSDQQYIEQLKKKNFDSLQRTLQTGNNSIQVGAETLNLLGQQREQLERTEEVLDSTHEDLNQSEWIIKGMKSMWGGFTNMFSGPEQTPQNYKDITARKEIAAKPSEVLTNDIAGDKDLAKRERLTNEEQARKLNVPIREPPKRQQRNYENKGTNAGLSTQEEEEESQQLDAILGMVSNMRGIAEQTGVELENQNKLLHRLDNKIDYTKNRIDKNTKNAKQLLND